MAISPQNQERALAIIENMPISLDKPLTGEIKKALIKIIEDEYQNQTTLTDQEKADVQAVIVAEYYERYKIEELAEEYRALEAKKTAIGEKLEACGFNTEGSYYTGYSPSKAPKAQAMRDAVSRAQARFQEPRTEKNKIMARLQLAGTYGEATAILIAVMGNGILPRPTEAQLMNLVRGGVCNDPA